MPLPSSVGPSSGRVCGSVNLSRSQRPRGHRTWVDLAFSCTSRLRRRTTLEADAKGGNDMFKNILLPVDGSEHALKAVTVGIGLASQLNAKVYGVHVVPPLPAVSYVAELLQSRGSYTDLAKERAQGYLDEIAKRSTAAGVPCETEFVFDLRPYVAIVAAATKHHCDLIVMASRGYQGIERVLLGSVTHKVMLCCDVPVLVC